MALIDRQSLSMLTHPRRQPSGTLRNDTVASEDPSFAVEGALRHPGQPLDASIRAAVEQRLGFDFSRVRIHTDESAAESARALHARAYTLGPHIVFGSGSYAPDTEAGRHRLHHELSHVMQQRRGSPMPDGPLQLGAPDSVHERQAQRMARAASPAEAQSLRSGTAPLHPAVIARDSGSPETAERQARNAYPNNPRAAALQKKMILGTITKPEMSELRGIASFPDNPRGALLYAKMDAGTITPAEQEELRGYFSRRETRLRAFDAGPASLSLDGTRESPRAAALRAKEATGPLSREEQAELQGLNGYPGNPRGAALAAKRTLGTITKKESAELQGFDTYPRNRRVAALYTRTLLGEKLTPSEMGEIHDESFFQQMGEYLIRLERKAREGRFRDQWEAGIYEQLRRDPKVLQHAAEIRRSGGPAFSVFDD